MRSLLLLFPLALVPSLQGPLTSGSAPATLVEDEAAALERALEAVDADKIEADLTFIASDELAGRDTPSEGLRMAARFIRARLERLGFAPAGGEGDFFHRYQLSSARLDPEASYLRLLAGDMDESMSFGDGYYFWGGGTSDSTVVGDVVFAGDGTADQVQDVDLEGAWALVFDSQISSTQRTKNLRARGAIGLLVASQPGGADEHSRERGKAIRRYMSRPSLRLVDSGEGGSFPQVFLAADVCERLTRGIVPEVGQSLEVEVTDERHVAQGSEVHELENVAGLWPGSDPELSKEVLIVSAHYDHVGEHDGEIYNGADDNGSGTSGMLAIAEALAAHGPMKRSVLLLWVSGEEKGLLGSAAWTKDPTLPPGMRAVANLNIDMIGRNAPDYLLITPTAEHEAYNGLTRMAEKVAPLEGFPELGSCDEYWRRSDHMNFSENLGIPVAFLFSDVHEDYHQPSDTVEKIDFDKIARVTRVVVRMLDELQDLELALL